MNRVVDYLWLCVLLVSPQKMVGVAGYNNCLKDRVKWLIKCRSLTVEISPSQKLAPGLPGHP